MIAMLALAAIAAMPPQELTPADFGWTRITDPKHKAWKHRFVPDVKTKALFLLDIEKFKSRIPKVVADDKSPDGTIKERVLLPLPDGTFYWFTLTRGFRVEEEAAGQVLLSAKPRRGNSGVLSVTRYGLSGFLEPEGREIRIMALSGEKQPISVAFYLDEFRRIKR